MPRSRVPLLLLTATVAACDRATAPMPTPIDAGPNAIVFPFMGYTATLLPVIPAGINDSGVIAGTVGAEAVRYFSGTTTILPRAPGVGGGYVAQAINSSGGIVGNVAVGRGLFWRKPNQIPYQIISPTNETVLPLSVNNSNLVVGSFIARDPSGASTVHAFTWSTSMPFTDITPPGFVLASAMDVNEGGWIVGYGWKADNIVLALRWPPGAGNAAQILGPGVAPVVATNGDALGMTDGFAAIHAWTFNGASISLAGPQASNIDDISGHGRVVGFTYAHATVNPHKPWTRFGGTTTWLPVPDAANHYNIEYLRVNACGSIVGTQTLNSGARQGVLYTKRFCDVGGITLG